MPDETPDEIFDRVLAEQRRSWLTGERVALTEWLKRYPAIAGSGAMAELVYHEFALRCELGEAPEWDDYLRQFPACAVALRRMRQADALVNATLLRPSEPIAGDFDDYELLEEIGRGGMGVVYKARQRLLGRTVALKVLGSAAPVGSEERRRFDVEAQAVACLHHPNVVQIYEVGEWDGEPFLALEYVEGHSLARCLADMRLTPRQAASMLATLARAVHYAHEQGIIHRDLKPSNVLLAGPPHGPPEHWVAKLTDFGLAKRLGSPRDTSSRVTLGTPSYMAPEQTGNRAIPIDAHTDVYGLGAVLYEMLTGQPPFRAESPLETIQQVVTADPVRPRLLDRKVPRDLETICLQCLEKQPNKRYSSAASLADDLDRWLGGKEVRARPVGPLGRAQRWCRRRPLRALLVAALVISLLSGSLTSMVLWRRAVNSANDEAIARREAEERYGMLRELFIKNVRVVAYSNGRPAVDSYTVPLPMLLDVEAYLTRLLEQNPDDVEMRSILADTCLRLGVRSENERSSGFLERAVLLWETLPLEFTRGTKMHAARASAYHHLGTLCSSRRQFVQALSYFKSSFQLWSDVVGTEPSEENRDGFYQSVCCLTAAKQDVDLSSEGLSSWFNELAAQRDLLGAETLEVLLVQLDIVHASHMCKSFALIGEHGPSLALVWHSALQLETCWQRITPISLGNAKRLTGPTLWVCGALRRGGAQRQSLALADRLERLFTSLSNESPDDHFLFTDISRAWYEVSKGRWLLGDHAGALDAIRQSLMAQRHACTLAPMLPEYRHELGWRHLQLARKLCELGQLDEAETVLRQRQALWSGDVSKADEAVRELRKWATQAGSGEKLSPEEQLEKQRYLDLATRLESRGANARVSDRP